MAEWLKKIDWKVPLTAVATAAFLYSQGLISYGRDEAAKAAVLTDHEKRIAHLEAAQDQQVKALAAMNEKLSGIRAQLDLFFDHLNRTGSSK